MCGECSHPASPLCTIRVTGHSRTSDHLHCGASIPPLFYTQLSTSFHREEFEHITEGLSDALGFARTIGLGADGADRISYEQGGGRGVLGEVELFTSHEGLMLDFEEAMTRTFPVPSSLASSARSAITNASPPLDGPVQGERAPRAHYNTSAHFLWIGDRTRQLTGAHVEYFRGVRNPIGVKVGPTMQADEVVRLLDSEQKLCSSFLRLTLMAVDSRES